MPVPQKSAALAPPVVASQAFPVPTTIALQHVSTSLASLATQSPPLAALHVFVYLVSSYSLPVPQKSAPLAPPAVAPQALPGTTTIALQHVSTSLVSLATQSPPLAALHVFVDLVSSYSLPVPQKSAPLAPPAVAPQALPGTTTI